MSEHTKEPWEAVTLCPGQCCWNLRKVGQIDPYGLINHPEMSAEDARRIVACVNACAGIPTDDLEMSPNGGLFYLADFANQTVQQRDKLLASLKDAYDFMIGFEDDEAQEGINDLLAEIKETIDAAQGQMGAMK